MPVFPPITEYCDVAVVGAGGAGLRAAVSAAQRGLDVVCLTKVPPTRSHTVAAQGGINAALGNSLPDDWRWHMYDTIRGSDWLGDQDSIAAMCEAAPAAIRELEHLGMPFTRDSAGRIYQRPYGGQYTDFGKGPHAHRACAVADRTGHSLLHTLYAQAVRHRVRFMTECMALDLLMDGGACRGVLAWKLESGELIALRAHTVIIASGGYGQAWASTTSSSICTGDGGGMVLRAGLPLQDMEFVQFHPTCLAGTGILITEGARGEGAHLTNASGERFMQHYAPGSLELASRDVIARAMAVEIQAGRGCGPHADHLHLRLDHLKPELVRERLPTVLEVSHAFARIDALKDPIPVAPAVHYTMGGIAGNAACEVITLDAQGLEQPVPGLLAIGEAACGSVHGANRLGCNSLLELVVFGRIAGERVTGGGHHPVLPAHSLEAPLERMNRLLNASGASKPSAILRDMQRTMQRHAGIFRERELLQSGAEKLHALWQRFTQDLRIGDRSLLWNNELAQAWELDNLLRQAIATVACAIAREESRGAHWRQDHPARDDAAWMKHTLAWLDENAKPRLNYRPVRMYKQGETLTYPPEPRVY